MAARRTVRVYYKREAQFLNREQIQAVRDSVLRNPDLDHRVKEDLMELLNRVDIIRVYLIPE